MSRLKDKVAIITGASSGIGLSAASLFIAEGAKIILVARRERVLKELCDSLNRDGVVAHFIAGDLNDPTTMQKAIDMATQHYGRLDIAFNNAGITCETTAIGDMDNAVWHKLLNTNLNSVFYCIKHQVKLMSKAKQGGAIVNTSSMLGLIGTKNRAAYVTSKHAVTGLTKAAALDYAEQNIRVNSIHPGYIETPLIAHIDHAALVAKHPIGRLGQSDEVADLVVFLLSDQAKFITGAQYVIDGGYSIL